ncbi:MAG: cytochrome P450 [Pseudonocardia sp.]
MSDHDEVTSAGAAPELARDLADPRFWERPEAERREVFARLRRLEQPVFVQPPGGRGYHALVRHADVVAASKDSELFSNEPAVTTPEPPAWVKTVFGESMVNMDGKAHKNLRTVVSKAFTPRRVAGIVDDIHVASREIVDDVIARRPADFVHAVAAQLPVRTICDMMGIAPKDREWVLAQVSDSTEHIGVRRPLLRIPGQNLRALAKLHLLVRAVGRERRRDPRDDLVSALVTANVDGQRLSGRQLGSFFSLLLVAGIETTRNAIALGLKLLTEHPDQREILLGDLDGLLPGAVDEMVRFATPIRQFRRRVTRDETWRGYGLHAEDRVVLFYVSANRDEDVFPDPDRFDVTRAPNPHVGFGGGGAHFCLGAHLARTEMKALFGELLRRLPEVRMAGEPTIAASSFDNRVLRMPFTF